MEWDNNRPQHQYFEKPRESTTFKYFKVGLGLMLGMVAAWAIYVMVVGTFIVSAANEMQDQTTQRIQTQIEKIRIQAEQQKIAAQQEAARKQQMQELKLQWEAQQRAEQNRRQLEAAEAEMRERKAKEAAWERFYKKRPECENPSNSAVFVECGNEYMRAKQRFEQLWQEKMLKL